MRTGDEYGSMCRLAAVVFAVAALLATAGCEAIEVLPKLLGVAPALEQPDHEPNEQ